MNKGDKYKVIKNVTGDCTTLPLDASFHNDEVLKIYTSNSDETTCLEIDENGNEVTEQTENGTWLMWVFNTKEFINSTEKIK